MKITQSVSDIVTHNMLAKERVYNRLLVNGFEPTSDKGHDFGRKYFEWEVYRAIHDMRRLVAQETLA